MKESYRSFTCWPHEGQPVSERCEGETTDEPQLGHEARIIRGDAPPFSVKKATARAIAATGIAKIIPTLVNKPRMMLPKRSSRAIESPSNCPSPGLHPPSFVPVCALRAFT